MKAFVPVLAALAIVGGAARSTLAHHSFAAEYDDQKPLKITGTLTKVEWMNPHIYFYMDAADQSGKVVNWAVEGATPNHLYRRGWKSDSLKVGDMVTVEAVMARQPGLHHVNGRSVVLPDGRKVFSGSAEDALPQRPAAKPATR